MTLIVSCLYSESFVAQITDRRVTTQSGKPFDELSNKTLIYWAKDAIVSMAYTGPAYIEDWPTDAWIAWKLWGKSLDRFNNTGGGNIIRVPPHQYHIGQAIRLLESELKASEIARTKSAFELHIVGWKWKLGKSSLKGKKRPIPVQWMMVQKPDNEIKTQYIAHKRHPLLALHAAPDRNITIDNLEGISERIRRSLADSRGAPWEDRSRKIEDEVVKSIRDVAAANPFIGQDCMSVLIAPPHRQPFVRVRFFTESVYRARDLGVKSAPEQYEASFSPWIIGPSSAMAPQLILAEWSVINLGPFKVRLEGKKTEPVFTGKGHIAVQGFFDYPRPRRPR
jgi:hypothetical protein